MGSALLCCEGGCLRSFHTECLQLDGVPEGEFVCEQCTQREHPCFICRRVGRDDTEVIQCSERADGCGKFFHEACLAASGLDYVLKTLPPPPPHRAAAATGGETAARRLHKLRCPYHRCYVCSLSRGARSGGMQRCLLCPRAYHRKQCTPLHGRVHPSPVGELFICPLHPDDVLPEFDLDPALHTALGLHLAQVGSMLLDEGKLDGMIEDGTVRMAQPAQCKNFMLAQSNLDRCMNALPDFKGIQSNDYTLVGEATKKRLQAEAHRQSETSETGSSALCDCRDGVCGDICVNRMTRVECSGTGAGVGGAGGGGGGVARSANCAIGPACGNRAFSQRGRPKTEPFHEFGRGWGLRAGVDIPAGTLVIEYLGEVLDETMVAKRLEAQKAANDRDYYIMELANGYFLDGKVKGNLSRFINHSCDPNLELQRWVVRGVPRIGIFALEDIPAGTPLSYDYQFESYDKNPIVCRCGAPSCRGFLMAQRRDEDDDPLAGLDIAALSRRDRRRMIKDERLRTENFRRRLEVSLTRPTTVPSDDQRSLWLGPDAEDVAWGRRQGLFTVRSLRAGMDLPTRLHNRGRPPATRRGIRPSTRVVDLESIVAGLRERASTPPSRPAHSAAFVAVLKQVSARFDEWTRRANLAHDDDMARQALVL